MSAIFILRLFYQPESQKKFFAGLRRTKQAGFRCQRTEVRRQIVKLEEEAPYLTSVFCPPSS
ncbi:MAG: hypothetical protein KAR15_17875, partial [Desulfobacterales bacterium]|nr:hypothetical protein [Desulfobacterales bacterium]